MSADVLLPPLYYPPRRRLARSSVASWGLALAALCTACPVRADVVEVPASADTTLYADSGTLGNGVGEFMFAGLNASSQSRRALIAFDVAGAVPLGSTIDDVELVLNMSKSQTGDTTVSVHHVDAAWGEGSSDAAGEEGAGGAAQPGDATWSHRVYDATTWTTAGGDFDAGALASSVVGAVGTYSWSSTELTAEVQGLLDAPATNFGWLLLGEGTGIAKRFDSRQNATASLRPKLIVTFTPSSATGACCEADGRCGLVLHSESPSECSSGYQGMNSACTPNPCPQPPGACCLPDVDGSCMDLDEATCAARSGAFQGSGSECSGVSCPAVLPPFVDALPILPVAQPQDGTEGGAAEYTLSMTELGVKVHRDLPETTVWGFDDGSGAGASFPGPVIEAFTGEPVTVTWENELRDDSGDLRDEHYLPVDDCIHGAEEGPPKAIMHLHGGHVPARFDGFPNDAFPPGESATYEYPNTQPAATLWYHDHALGVTRLNVYMGLAGMYVLRDADERALDLPSGAYEIPLVIQDRSFRGDGSLIYPEMFEEHFFGDSMLVNGKVWPYLDVDQGKYRFRVLNACNGRTLSLSLDDGASFEVIGTDGGLLSEPVTVDAITLGAGERAELVIDFAGYASGTELVLKNDAPAPYPGSAGVGVVGDVMKFVVGNDAGYTDALPSSLVEVAPIDEDDSVRSRDFVLQADSPAASSCGHREWLINGLHWDELTEYPRLGTTEIWRFVNPSGVSHPMHMHLVQFQILDRQAADVVDGEVELMGSAAPPADEEAGWKDTVMVQPGEAVRVIATFTDYTGKFTYHCHILEHEDHAMMRQFVTTTVCGDGVLGQPAEECDDEGESEDCDEDCSAALCGDGLVNASAGELCDDGSGGGDPEACKEPCLDAGVAGDAGTDAGGVGVGGAGDGGGAPDAGDAGGAGQARDAGDGDGSGGDDGCSCRVGVGARDAAGSSPGRGVLFGALLLALRLAHRRRARQH